MLSGPGGVGKGTMAAELVQRDPQLWLSRSHTTRLLRPDEAPDAYVFTSRADFEAGIAAGRYLEWAETADNLYGTPWPDPPPGKDMLLEIDVQGAEQVLARTPDALCIFVEAPSEAEQRARLEARGDPPEAVTERIALADTERAQARRLGAVTVVNDDLEQAVDEVARLIRDARQGTPGS